MPYTRERKKTMRYGNRRNSQERVVIQKSKTELKAGLESEETRMARIYSRQCMERALKEKTPAAMAEAKAAARHLKRCKEMDKRAHLKAL